MMARWPLRHLPGRRPAVPGGAAAQRRDGLVGREELSALARQLVDGLFDGTMSETAYDTAVVARLRSPRDPGEPAYPASLLWLRRAQREDGSWGGRIPVAHDRIVSTLAAVTSLAGVPDPWAQEATQAGLAYLREHGGAWRADPHETIAFELLVPQLLDEVARLGFDLPYPAFEALAGLRDEKLRRIPDGYLYERPTTLVHSLEFLGGALDRRLVGRLRADNGSYGNSPSATAHVLAHVGDACSEAYLARVMGVSLDGGAPNVYPFEVFERLWTLYNLGLGGAAVPGGQPHLRYLAASLRPDGVGISREGLIPDADDTAMALIVLGRAGTPVGCEPLRSFEREEWFACFPFERNTSISANARVLEALKECAGHMVGHHGAVIAKLLAYLGAARLAGGYWQDKWHVSPYYATAQVAFAARDIADEMVAPARAWLLETQRADGSWGRYAGTREETAYAMQTLLALRPPGGPATGLALARGAAFLSASLADTDYEELWIGKGLYAPYAVVRSAIIAALLLYDRYRDADGGAGR